MIWVQCEHNTLLYGRRCTMCDINYIRWTGLRESCLLAWWIGLWSMDWCQWPRPTRKLMVGFLTLNVPRLYYRPVGIVRQACGRFMDSMAHSPHLGVSAAHAIGPRPTHSRRPTQLNHGRWHTQWSCVPEEMKVKNELNTIWLKQKKAQLHYVHGRIIYCILVC